jgi:multiple sugar transport system ATP-binding protein
VPGLPVGVGVSRLRDEGAMSTVQLRGVRKVYPDGHVAVADVDLDIGEGELFVLVGPSGCGKSSLLRMIAGLESISAGDVLVDGVRVNELPTNTRNLSMVFQSPALYPHLTVRENLGFPLKMAGIDKATATARVSRVADLLGLGGRLDWRHQALSGGERQRVAMGRAIVRQPDLLLMDEPMSNLDAKLRTELRSELLRLQRRLGTTTVYVTHDQVEAMALGDRVAVMRDGRIVQCGPPVDVYRHPKDSFVAQFIGTPPMNLLVARIVRSDGGLVLLVGSQRMSIGDMPTRWPELVERAGEKIIVGIRPEAFRWDSEGELLLSLRFHEQLGTTQWIHAVTDAQVIDTTESQAVREPTIVAAVEGRGDVSLWEPLRLAVDHGGLHFFDLQTGLALVDRSLGVRPPSGRSVDARPATSTSEQ